MLDIPDVRLADAVLSRKHHHAVGLVATDFKHLAFGYFRVVVIAAKWRTASFGHVAHVVGVCS